MPSKHGGWRPNTGGTREGAGRKPYLAPEEHKTPITVRLTQAERERLSQLGNGNIANGIRALLSDSPSK